MKSRLFPGAIAILLGLSLVACGSPSSDKESSSESLSPSEASPTSESAEQTDEFLPLEIRECGYAVTEKGYLYVAVVLHNPNADYCVEFPSFRVTARDADGILLGTNDQVLSVIYPQQDFCYAGQMFKVEDTPSTVDFEALPPSEYNIVKPQNVDYPNYQPLTITNSTVREDRIMGEIRNCNDFDIDSSIVAIIYRDESGKIVGGDSTFISNVSASSDTPFDLSVHSDFYTGNHEIYANIW